MMRFKDQKCTLWIWKEGVAMRRMKFRNKMEKSHVKGLKGKSRHVSKEDGINSVLLSA